MSAAIQPIPLTLADLDEAAGVLGRATVNDPIFVYCLPDKADREWGVPRIQRAFLKLGMRQGEAWSTPRPITGVAWCITAEVPNFSPQEVEAAGLTAAGTGWGEEAFARFLEFRDDIREFAAGFGEWPHWHLAWIGVEPREQGRGISSAFMRQLTSQTDAAGIDCDLFNFVPRNVALYEHFGFDVSSDTILPRTGLRLWSMIRKPNPAPGTAHGV